MYTYALIKTPETPLELPPGLVGDLEVVTTGTLAAITEPQLSPTKMEALVQDDQLLEQAYIHYGVVVCDLFAKTTILPLKFYHCFRDRLALEEHLTTHQDQYLNTLNTLDGKGEYILKAFPKPLELPPLDKEQKGKAYFLAKKQRYQQQQEYQNQQNSQWQTLTEQVLALYPEAVIPEPQEDKWQLFWLAQKDRRSLLEEHLFTWQELCPDWDLNLSDPIPPYDFLE
ncbi:MAG: GvpL/GvpF family gas vesicle protein [Roseofilum sp. SBFL]|uniref:GvpL/GvpF family gas vesicle protein n=1 Tax=unclassified Roseofilum TaxID=2620099 RepID=UPI001B2CCF5B|nr:MULTISPECIES: GvpL/GvpF family gas vesicle protein [unclassified Roseofilum]MBP0013929.1 GvpL/GvpF family gas vesicle protein [Roseofilum sp. SID3]MBP0023630.1 GvpL/GvpF family gas vesicle protein [Roseofilum sp. SID2]MBP0038964.1 GvpL/GvpF family gas vesicle protein [Roseofilum sp. SID1]MBP0041763.1 GvpL/GvpF family gas vesicle protein [Roseofilum sp. SBFL]